MNPLSLLVLLVTLPLLLGGCGEKESDSVTLPLSDADVERLLKEAIDFESLQRRNGLLYQVNESEPYNGWTKMMYKNVLNPAHLGRKRNLTQIKGGKPIGIATGWFPNGQKVWETTYKDGKVGHSTVWHENGQKAQEETYKDGEEVSAKYWNSKGEPVDSEEEANK